MRGGRLIVYGCKFLLRPHPTTPRSPTPSWLWLRVSLSLYNTVVEMTPGGGEILVPGWEFHRLISVRRCCRRRSYFLQSYPSTECLVSWVPICICQGVCRIKPTCVTALFDLACWSSGSPCQISVSNLGRRLSQGVAYLSPTPIAPPIPFCNEFVYKFTLAPSLCLALWKNIPCPTRGATPARIAHVFLIIIIVFVLVLRKCPFCMLDQPVEKSNITEVQGELHPGPCISLPALPFCIKLLSAEGIFQSKINKSHRQQ